MAKKFENERHVIHESQGCGVFESLVNSAFGLTDPTKVSIYDKETTNWGEGVSSDRREAESHAWRDLRSKNESER